MILVDVGRLDSDYYEISWEVIRPFILYSLRRNNDILSLSIERYFKVCLSLSYGPIKLSLKLLKV